MDATPPAASAEDIDQLAINTIRTLSIDAVQKAKSGHPGTPMGLAPVAYTVWQDLMRFDPADPGWPNRDRFVLSVGHASMLLYSLLYLSGTRRMDLHSKKVLNEPAVSLDDIMQFRQLSSVTPGHPEYGITTGVETTTGPLGQGVATSVGMAMAQRWMAERYNKPGFEMYGYKIYVLCGDGDMMEGVSAEAASMAGHLKLSNLVWLYDSNHITIEGNTALAFDEDVGKRFEAYGWHVAHVDDANDTAAVRQAIAEAADDKPTFIVVHSVIGYGAPKKAGTREAHGEPLGEEEVRGAKRAYGLPEDKQFYVPDGVMQHFTDKLGKRGATERARWMDLLAEYRKKYPELAAELDQMDQRELPEGWDKDVPVFEADAKGIASRDSSQKVLTAIAKNVPWLLGGAADLAPSTKTDLKFADSFESTNYSGRNLHFGIREHAMGSVVNGLALAGLRPYGSTFLIFSDYMKAPVRLSSIMELPTIWIFTHDSIGVGEDGPTHQPIEQLISLRAIPGMTVLRPADANEVAEAWRVIMKLQHRPATLVLSRQALPTLDRSKLNSAAGVAKGAYVLRDTPGTPDVILMATGSEVAMCIDAAATLEGEGLHARVVSMPSWDIFEQQDEAYRHSVLPQDVTARVGIEQAGTFGWDRYVGATGTMLGMHTFGASAPLAKLQEKFGFTPAKLLEAARDQAKQGRRDKRS